MVGLITESLVFGQDARDVMVLFDEWLGVLGSVVFLCWTIPLQDDTPVCHDCLVVNGTSTFITNICTAAGVLTSGHPPETRTKSVNVWSLARAPET